ncbi:hypothetical protein CA267_001920 [Alteromonas pelagimontana]|uniref:Type II toxin-antitoxin system YhaV family toxin n=1 Tax=Alteromonas pelagimontana TaxID=1858656 RepID=A0A6M4M8W4_9ALTE|nr:type II toxin-antitoxin system YhaV family toxin [Alteromonas pelagimontana]QJR79641.1 hypothetical protein CA267_001920 [Alteromonas pelagimontana]
MKVHGWTFYWHKAFQIIYSNLLSEVVKLSEKDPDHFDQHPTFKLYESVNNCIFHRVAPDPAHKQFNLGDTFRERNMKHWRRVKKGMPYRFRLFFQYNSGEGAILLAWLNDHSTLRKHNAKTDVYTVFKKKVASGEIPNSFNDLLKECTAAQIQKSS